MVSRAEHRRATLLKLGEAAICQFEIHGVAATIDEIARQAGVSRRTVFRYVDSKEALAFVHPLLWFDVFDAALAEAPSTPLSERLRVGSRAIALHIDADPDPPHRAFKLVATRPEFSRGYSTIFGRWIDRVAQEVLRATPPPPDAHDRFRARIIGAAVMGMVDAVTREWVASPRAVRFTQLYDEGFSLLVPLLDAASDPRRSRRPCS